MFAGVAGAKMRHVRRLPTGPTLGERWTRLRDAGSRRPTFLAGSFGLVLLTALIFPPHTARGRLNVMQVAATLFFILVLTGQSQRAKASSGADSPSKDSLYGLWLGLALAVGLYALNFPLYFIGDDFDHLYYLCQFTPRRLVEGLLRGYWWNADYFRPVGMATLWLECQLWHYNAAGYHFTNLILHLVCAVGLFLLCRSLGLWRETAAIAAMVFALLPVQAEAVAWVSARFDLLAAALVVWSLLLYSRFRRTGRWGWYVGALVAFLIAAFSKENAYVLPFLVVLLEFFVLPQRRLKPALGFFALAGAAFTYRWTVLGGIGYVGADVLHFGFKTLEGLFIRAPAQLLLGYNWVQPSAGYFVVTPALTGAFFLALAFVVEQEASQRRWTWFALGWILLASLPLYPLLLIGADLANSRFLYLGMGGLAILVSVLLARVEPPRLRQVGTLGLALLLSLGLLHNLGAWRAAGSICQTFLADLKRLEPVPAPKSTFVFIDMPYKIRGVYFLNNGLPEAVNMTYRRQDLYARRERGPSQETTIDRSRGPLIRLKWKGTGETLLERVP
jgi:hypothetical protein